MEIKKKGIIFQISILCKIWNRQAAFKFLPRLLRSLSQDGSKKDKNLYAIGRFRIRLSRATILRG